MLYNIQILRAVAAILVVHAHAAGLTGLVLSWAGGAEGVDLFFVISGFIITYVAHQDAGQFMTRRLIRIVPIYWASTLAIFVLVLVLPNAFRTGSSDLGLLIRSLLFVPDPSSVHSSDGIPHPTLAGGWTLNYEMYFYVMFWLALTISRRWASLIASTILGAIVAVVHLTPLDSISVVAHFYGHPIVLEFVYGVAAFHLVNYLVLHFKRATPPALDAVLATVIAVGVACLAFKKEIFGPSNDTRWIVSGIPALGVVVSAMLFEHLRNVKVTNRVAVLVGDASYVLYLLHAYVVFGVIRVAVGKRTFSETVGQGVAFVLVLVSVLVAVAAYHYFERPVLRWLKARFVTSHRDRARPASAR